jgi:anaphase-promoting complex subunit 3
MSPTTPSFGVLPLVNSPNINDQSGIMIMTPSPQPPTVQPQAEQNDLLNSNKKMRGPQQMGNMKSTLLQQQSTNTTKPVFTLT